MAIETLKDIIEIGGNTVVIMDELRERYPDKFQPSGQMDWKWFESEIRPKYFIYVRHDKNSISFTIQDGPVKEHGVNGCQLDALIHAAKHMIERLNLKFSCRENAIAITKLDEALMWLDKRTKDRTDRGVEGQSLR